MNPYLGIYLVIGLSCVLAIILMARTENLLPEDYEPNEWGMLFAAFAIWPLVLVLICCAWLGKYLIKERSFRTPAEAGDKAP